MRKKKIAIIGAGNAAIITSLFMHLYSRIEGDIVDDITIYYDSNVPIERVGQGHTLPIIRLIFDALDMDWKNNSIGAVIKTGINYENWGKKNHNFFHDFALGLVSFHYSPHLLSKAVIESGLFNIVEKNIINPEEEIDADYIFDCRGRPTNNSISESGLYDKLTNPLNSVILSKMDGKDVDLTYTRCVATPDGWTFVIPNVDSVSYGYLYNNNITTKDDATNNFIDMFNVVPDGSFSFKNYIGKNIWVGDRTIINGNRFTFLEPMEATSTAVYRFVAYYALQHIMGETTREAANHLVRKQVKRIESFVLWHYQYGSKFDTPFWDYAKSLPFNPDNKFKEFIKYTTKTRTELIHIDPMGGEEYGLWPTVSFKVWTDNM